MKQGIQQNRIKKLIFSVFEIPLKKIGLGFELYTFMFNFEDKVTILSVIVEGL